MVDRRAGMAVRLRDFFGFEELHFAGHGRIGIAAGCRIDVAQQPAVMRIAVMVAHGVQCRMGFLEVITKRHAAAVAFVAFRRARKAHAAERLAGVPG